MRNGALRTANDVNSYVDDAMKRIGYTKSDAGKWTIPENNAVRVKEFNSEFGKTSSLRATGLTDAEITESIVRYSAAEMYTVFHGSADVFNERLYSAITNKIQSGLEKVAKSRQFRGKDAMRRTAIGEELVTLSPNVNVGLLKRLTTPRNLLRSQIPNWTSKVSSTVATAIPVFDGVIVLITLPG